MRASFRDDKPLRWIRVHDLPDFVYFNHSIHVKKGVGCETCHGRVDRMPLMLQKASLQMEWCLDCHRDPASTFIRPREEIVDDGIPAGGDQREIGERLVREYKIADVRAHDELFGLPPVAPAAMQRSELRRLGAGEFSTDEGKSDMEKAGTPDLTEIRARHARDRGQAGTGAASRSSPRRRSFRSICIASFRRTRPSGSIRSAAAPFSS